MSIPGPSPTSTSRSTGKDRPLLFSTDTLSRRQDSTSSRTLRDVPTLGLMREGSGAESHRPPCGVSPRLVRGKRDGPSTVGSTCGLRRLNAVMVTKPSIARLALFQVLVVGHLHSPVSPSHHLRGWVFTARTPPPTASSVPGTLGLKSRQGESG